MPVEIRVIFRGEPDVNPLDAAPEPMDEIFAAIRWHGRLARESRARCVYHNPALRKTNNLAKSRILG